jgi:LmbE family N-acetylglucosaminyl deacetylase
MFEKSILIVAHPDDEILFFSSVLEKVDEILICYLNSKSHVEWSEGRKKSINQYPMKNVTWLGLDESESFFGVDWRNPVVTEYGLAISDKKISDTRYRENYSHLLDIFEKRLRPYKNVFTHNPWGEYGHCEHVQIFRAIKQLQQQLSFNLWYSNYCSNKSFDLMLRYVSGFRSNYLTFSTNPRLGEEIKAIYQKNHCWTWYDDWVWFQEESIIRDDDVAVDGKDYGHFFPLNIIKVESFYFLKKKSRLSLLRAMLSKIKKRVTVWM